MKSVSGNTNGVALIIIVMSLAAQRSSHWDLGMLQEVYFSKTMQDITGSNSLHHSTVQAV